ncbi:MAG: hypothetical protein HC809_04420 [Gammaproteobacteria bacterium]|nr:hypothetical protein [Gammaproteobacteria bacterium]
MATIDRGFSEYLLKAVDNPAQYGVHQLFNDWWRFAPDAVKDKYLKDFRNLPDHKAFIADGHYADPISIAQLNDHAEGTFGRAYYHFIVDNNLEEKIAINYRMFHEHLEKSGALTGMPSEIRYAVLRGFQVHDFMHVVTGYDSSPRSEIALQAFSLAQLKFPYFSMWMSVVTTRMTFIDPDMIVPTMDAITEGWQFGRRARNLAFEKWEARLDDPLTELRPKFGIAPQGKLALAA